MSEALTVIVGLGATGLSCVRYLTQQEVTIAVNDTRECPPQLDVVQRDYPDIECVLGELSESLLTRATQIVLSPGVSPELPLLQQAAQRGVDIIGDIELFARQVTQPVIAVTGSNGKSTVVTLMGLMIEAAGYRAAVCGNIGEPVLNTLLTDQPDYYLPDFYVIELSSFQLETLESLRPKTAVLLNLSEDHLDRHPDMTAYCAAKQRIYRQCEYPVVNANQSELWQALDLNNIRYFGELGEHSVQSPGFSLDLFRDSPDSPDLTWLCHHKNQKNQKLLPVSEVALVGRHNALNALACLAMGDAIGLPMSTMLQVLREFTGLPHRCQRVMEHHGVRWYNDSKGTNVGASVAAITSLAAVIPGKIILIVGGDAKNADLSDLCAPITEHVSHVILLGRDAERIRDTLSSLDGNITFHHVDSMANAVTCAAELATSGDAVLLSPACASFDMFRNFEHRGEVFTQAVQDEVAHA